MGKLLGRIVVTFTAGLIAFIAYSSQLFIIWPWYGQEVSVDLLKLLVPFKYEVLHRSDARLLMIVLVYWLDSFFGIIGTAYSSTPDGYLLDG